MNTGPLYLHNQRQPKVLFSLSISLGYRGPSRLAPQTISHGPPSQAPDPHCTDCHECSANHGPLQRHPPLFPLESAIQPLRPSDRTPLSCFSRLHLMPSCQKNMGYSWQLYLRSSTQHVLICLTNTYPRLTRWGLNRPQPTPLLAIAYPDIHA